MPKDAVKCTNTWTLRQHFHIVVIFILSEIVYVATINPPHAEQCIRLMNAGKNVLCEKPMTMNLKEAKQVFEVAKKQNVFFMEVRVSTYTMSFT